MSTKDFRPPHEERRPMHPQDSERLEWLEWWAKDSGDKLEDYLRQAEIIANSISNWREIHKRRTQARDDFRAAMEGMGCKL